MPRQFTLSTLVTRCKQRADMENSGLIGDPEWKGMISTVYGEMVSEIMATGLRHFEKEQTLDTNAFGPGGDGTWALAADHLSTIGVDYEVLSSTGERRRLRPQMVQRRNRYAGVVGQSEALEYALVGDNIEVYPDPPANQIYYHLYVPQPADLSSEADETTVDVVTPDGENFVTWGTAVLAKEESDTQLAMMERERMRARVVEWATLRFLNQPRERVVDDGWDWYEVGDYVDRGPWEEVVMALRGSRFEPVNQTRVVDGDWETAERSRRNHATAIQEIQGARAVTGVLLEGVELQDGVLTVIPHRLGRPGAAMVSPARNGGGRGWALVGETELSADGTYTFSGLNGTTDRRYRLSGSWIKAAAIDTALYVLVNGAGTNLRSAWLRSAEGAYTEGASATVWYLAISDSSDVLDSTFYFSAEISAEIDTIGHYRHYAGHFGGGDSNSVSTGTVGGTYADSATEITSLKIQTDHASNHLSSGSRLYLHRDAPAAGQIVETRDSTIDRSRYVGLTAHGYGATITVDLWVL